MTSLPESERARGLAWRFGTNSEAIHQRREREEMEWRGSKPAPKVNRGELSLSVSAERDSSCEPTFFSKLGVSLLSLAKRL